MMIYPKESVVSYYLSRIVQKTMYIPLVWSETMPHGEYVFFILEFTMRLRFVESHMLDPPPPGCNRGIHEGFRLGSLTCSANHQGFHLRSLEAFCLGQACNLHQMFLCLEAPKKNVRNIMCGATSTQSTKALFGKCFMQSGAKLLNSELDEIICSIYIVGSQCKIHHSCCMLCRNGVFRPCRKWWLLWQLPGCQLYMLMFFQMLMLQSHWNSHF